MEEPVRVRLVFEDRRVLTKSQRSAGLRRCWVLLKPDLATVGDLAAHLALRFALRTASAADIVLSMDGCVLPTFESAFIFKDKDIIRVRRKNLCMKEVTETVNLEEQPVVMSQKFLAKKNSTEDSHGYKNKAEDDAYAINDNTIPVDIPPDENVNSRRKRKHSDVLQDSKRKKLKSTSLDRHDATCEEQIVTAPKSSHRRAKPSKGDVASALVASQADDEVKKTPVSRKPLRQRKKELKPPNLENQDGTILGAECNHVEQEVTTRKSSKKKKKPFKGSRQDVVVTSQDDGSDDKTGTPRKNRNDHDGAKCQTKLPSRNARRKKARRQWLWELRKTQAEHNVAENTVATAPAINMKVATAPAINMKVALPQNTVAEKVAPVAIPQNTVVEKVTPVDTWEAAAPENVPEKVAPVNYCEVVAPGNVLEKASSTDIRGEMNIVNTSSTDKLESPAVNWGAPSSILDKKSDNWVSNNWGASSSNANKKPAPFSERSWDEQINEALIEKKAELEKNGGWGEKRAELQKNGGWGGEGGERRLGREEGRASEELRLGEEGGGSEEWRLGKLDSKEILRVLHGHTGF